MNISVVHHFELAITFGAPLPYIRRAYLIAAPRTMHHLQYAAIPGYFPAMAVFSAYFHLSCFVSYSSIVLNICNAACGTMAFPQAKPPIPLKIDAWVIVKIAYVVQSLVRLYFIRYIILVFILSRYPQRLIHARYSYRCIYIRATSVLHSLITHCFVCYYPASYIQT